MTILPTLTEVTRRRLIYAIIAIIFMLTLGSIGFKYFEDITWNESFYAAMQTVTTVGYGDLAPTTSGGKTFTTFFMLFGVGTVLYALTVLAQAVIQTEIVAVLGNRRKMREMEKLTDHFIVCGAGRVGRRIVAALQKEEIPFVLIERDEERVSKIKDSLTYYIVGDATSEENLIRASVTGARGIATCLADDAANVYVVLTARDLNRDLHIVARAVEEQAEPKLIRAGANRVVAPTIIGSQSMARALIKPAIADFMDSIVAENLDLVFEEVAVERDSDYNGKQLKETNISTELNLLVVAMRRRNGSMIFNPSADTIIEKGDLLIVIGKAESVQNFVLANN